LTGCWVIGRLHEVSHPHLLENLLLLHECSHVWILDGRPGHLLLGLKGLLLVIG
jgi:hypothetical protein